MLWSTLGRRHAWPVLQVSPQANLAQTMIPPSFPLPASCSVHHSAAGPALPHTPCSGYCGLPLEGIDLRWGDLPDVPNGVGEKPSFKDCCSACSARPDCVAYNWNTLTRLCYLKGATGYTATPCPECISAVISEQRPLAGGKGQGRGGGRTAQVGAGQGRAGHGRE